MAFLDILLLAGIALFLGYRLWLILGTHDVEKPIRKRRTSEDEDVVPVRSKAATEKKAKKAPQEEAAPIATDDDHFLQGAVLAFREIVEAYAMGNTKTLEKLLGGPLLETFKAAIASRKKKKQTLEVEISRVTSAEIIEKKEEKNALIRTVRFVSEQCLVTRGARGKVLEGDPDLFIEVTDLWTFSRPLKSNDPNWKLIATQIPEK